MRFYHEYIPTAEMSRKEKATAQARRRSILTDFAKEAMIAQGYQLGASLGVPGAHGFEATIDGQRVRVGVKTAADRWLSIPRNDAGEFGLLDKIDVLFTVTFDRWPDARKVQVYEIDPAALIEKARIAYDKAEELNHHGLQFLPFDEELTRKTATAQAAGHLLEIARLFTEEDIEWDGEAFSTPSEPSPETEIEIEQVTAPSRRLTIQEAKEGLALTFGVDPSAIKISIEA
ncbi:hypothetical protein [Salinarimonas rosea]|uniref:hypothetical protein n=1 Tax=Salinarimonas rosea TaxID=552063 RepID=UPI000418E884|nr:hypothetical protein [Salinarimonas rosea]